MPVVAVQETFLNRTGAVNDKREREYSRTFDVLMSTRTSDPVEVLLAPSLPRVWNPYIGANGTADLGSWCKDIRARQDTLDPYLWRVEAKYNSRLERPDLNIIENPLLRPADLSWDHVYVMKPLERDRDGNAILNSSYERFDPPPETEDVRQVLTVVRNQATYNAQLYQTYANTVNEVDWMGFKAGTVRLMKLSAVRQFENGILFWRVTFEFHIRSGSIATNEADAWAIRILDRGYFKWDGFDRELIRSPTGSLITTPALLDGDGGVLEPGDDPVYLTFHYLPQQDFADILPL